MVRFRCLLYEWQRFTYCSGSVVGFPNKGEFKSKPTPKLQKATRQSIWSTPTWNNQKPVFRLYAALIVDPAFMKGKCQSVATLDNASRSSRRVLAQSRGIGSDAWRRLFPARDLFDRGLLKMLDYAFVFYDNPTSIKGFFL